MLRFEKQLIVFCTKTKTFREKKTDLKNTIRKIFSSLIKTKYTNEC
jgi:hypothetical protein